MLSAAPAAARRATAAAGARAFPGVPAPRLGTRLAPSLFKLAPGLTPIPTLGAQALPLRAAALPAATRGAAIPAAAEALPLRSRLAPISASVSGDKTLLAEGSAEDARGAASRHIRLLLGEKPASLSALPSEPAVPPQPAPLPTARPSLLRRSDAPDSEPSAGPEETASPGSSNRIFNDPGRERAFRRLFLGKMLFLVGYTMYMMALPFFVQHLTRNTLRESRDERGWSPDKLNALVRQNRGLSRLAHWVAQGASYLSIPFFTRKAAQSRRWLLLSSLLRAAPLAGITGVFFFSGILSMPVAMGVFFLLVGVQSFFQGVNITLEAGLTNAILGDRSVTPQERAKANARLTLGSAIMSLVALLVSGQLLQFSFGKSGASTAVMYGIYSLAVAAMGLLFNSIRASATGEDRAQQKEASPAPDSPARSKWKELWGSLKEGLTLTWQNRFLRTQMILAVISGLFLDPLVFSVLPEFLEKTLALGSGAGGGLLGVPVLGWLLKGLLSTPMGSFGLLFAMQHLGSIAASLLMRPIMAVLKKVGFKNEESLTIPLYFLAALEIPLFWLMITSSSLGMILALYGLQSLVTGFIGILIGGLNQKNLSAYGNARSSRILAADSLVGIAVSIAVTFAYASFFSSVPLSVSLWIATAAVTLLGLLRVAAPWLSFSKDERRRVPPPDAKPPAQKGGDVRTEGYGQPPGGYAPTSGTFSF